MKTDEIEEIISLRGRLISALALSHTRMMQRDRALAALGLVVVDRDYTELHHDTRETVETALTEMGGRP